MRLPPRVKGGIRKVLPDRFVNGLKTQGSKTRKTLDYVVGYGIVPLVIRNPPQSSKIRVHLMFYSGLLILTGCSNGFYIN